MTVYIVVDSGLINWKFRSNSNVEKQKTKSPEVELLDYTNELKTELSKIEDNLKAEKKSVSDLRKLSNDLDAKLKAQKNVRFQKKTFHKVEHVMKLPQKIIFK